MSSVEANEVFSCTPEQFYSIISDYDKYPDFLSEVNSCKVVEVQGTRKLVEFEISMLKNFSYRLWMDESVPSQLTWSFDSGDLFKVSNGSWELKDKDGRTDVTYKLEAKFKGFVPGPIVKTAISVNLPNMMASYHKRVSQLFSS